MSHSGSVVAERSHPSRSDMFSEIEQGGQVRRVARLLESLGIVSNCEAMMPVFDTVQRVAKTGTTVLVLGESGTGKELIAQAIHGLSGRSGRLITVNCGAIPEEILESELFGHERGAFTGAVASRIGKFQLADEGTIFLDEIGEMSPKLQVKLLRVLQERRVDPVGSNKSIEVRVRVVAATNKDLRAEVASGKFRSDLYYRLQVVPITLPPLSERGKDVILLARYFLRKYAEKFGRKILHLAPEVEIALLNYRWPGNIRELQNLIERLVVLADGPIVRLSDLPEEIVGSSPLNLTSETDFIVEVASSGSLPALSSESNSLVTHDLEHQIASSGLDFNRAVQEFELRLITAALQVTGGNKKAAAQRLNLNRTTFIEKMRKQNLLVGRKEGSQE